MDVAGLPVHEISEKLFFSHRTIESHLYRIFPKLFDRRPPAPEP
jgi:DNA-binding NarL/FixJ family response regulator